MSNRTGSTLSPRAAARSRNVRMFATNAAASRAYDAGDARTRSALTSSTSLA